MANALQLRRGTTAQHSSFTGLAGEVTVDTDKSTIVVHDGSTAGGFPLALASNISSANLLTSIKTVDGAGSGLDADTLDGKQLATLEAEYQSYADTAVSNLVAAAPATLDTLNELAAALGDDPNFATTVTNSIATKLNSSAYTAADVLTKIKTVDGSGSGLDADTVDGIQASSFIRSDATDTATGAITFSNSSGITISEAQLYHETDLSWKGLTVKNLGNANEVHVGGRTSDGVQRLMVYADTANQGFLNPTNNAWKLKIPTSGSLQRDNAYTIWDSGNDGSGSGLDADTVDGIQGANLLRSDTSDTMSGTLTADGVTVNGTLDIEEVFEKVILATSTSGTVGFDVTSYGVVFASVNQTANRTINFQNVNSSLAVGQSVTCTMALSQGATPYYLNAYQVDGTTVTPKWAGGSAPTEGNASGIDVYTFTIIKTANATFTVLASVTQYA